jgi:hypothetical protein
METREEATPKEVVVLDGSISTSPVKALADEFVRLVESGGFYVNECDVKCAENKLGDGTIVHEGAIMLSFRSWRH